jgi:hypothetical protein
MAIKLNNLMLKWIIKKNSKLSEKKTQNWPMREMLEFGQNKQNEKSQKNGY